MKAYAMITDGTEEVECLAVVDILRRANIDTVLVSASGKEVVGSHGIKIIADSTVGEVDLTAADLLFIPGGMPGTDRLAACEPLIDAIGKMLDGGKRIAAICAAPARVLGAKGFLRGKSATCYPGHEKFAIDCEMRSDRVVTDGLITTAKGLGCSIELGLELVKLLMGEEKADALRSAVCA